MGKGGFPGLLACAAALLVAAMPARADYCAQLRSMIAEIDRNLQRNLPANERNYQLQARNTYVKALRTCSGGGGSAGYSGGGYSRGERAMNILGGIANILGTMQQHQREQNHRLANEANEEGKRYSAAGDYDMAALAFRRALDYLQANGDTDNIAIVEENLRRAERAAERKRANEETLRQIEETSRRIQEAHARFGDGDAFSGGNPFSEAPAPAHDSTVTGIDDGERSESEIKARCASAQNPAACESVERDYERRFGARNRERARESARLDANIRKSQAELDRVIAEHGSGEGRPAAAPAPVYAPRGPASRPYVSNPFKRQELASAATTPEIHTPGTDPVCRPGINCYDLTGGAAARQAAPQSEDGPKESPAERRARMEALKRRSDRHPYATNPFQGDGGTPEASQADTEGDGAASAEEPVTTAAVSADSAEIPPGYRRELMVSEETCKHWQGTYRYVPGELMPVCDYPAPTRPHAELQMLEQEAHEAALQLQRDVEEAARDARAAREGSR